jgi:ABC-type uncharacterized transport system substrate-binding protein
MCWNMTNRWSNDEKEETEEKDKKMKKLWKDKSMRNVHFESRYFKMIWQDEKKTKRLKRGQKEE